jgi:formamidopyrimidine-DNA glycosylase
MTGLLLWSPSGHGLPYRHLRARLLFTRGSLLFIDARRFGVMRLLTELDGVFAPGLDPLSPEFTSSRLAQLLSTGKQELKPWLLRQDRLVGLGNIYASEVLFAARLHPQRLTTSLAPAEIKRLHNNTRRLLQRAIKYCGTTFANFQDGHGHRGRFLRFLKVYGREHAKCLRCGQPIRRIVQQGRSTFFCPECQPPAEI